MRSQNKSELETEEIRRKQTEFLAGFFKYVLLVFLDKTDISFFENKRGVMLPICADQEVEDERPRRRRRDEVEHHAMNKLWLGNKVH